MAQKKSFKSHISYNVGNGKRIAFWEDIWCTSQPLKNSFPLLFEITIKKESSVEELNTTAVGSLSWTLDIRRRLLDRELKNSQVW